MVQEVSADRAVGWGHETVSNAKSCQIDLDRGHWVLIVDLLGDRRNKFSCIGFAERIEWIGLVLREEFEELD